ncbi:hypothetical protein TURU_006383 [Turdus rufiventris]|nr:hypothetical protein TURU_006383 [Turdus rufiventris]
MCKTCISACEQCRKQLERHPLEDDPLHLRNDKGLWDVWQVDYIGPFRKSSDKKFILVGVEIIAGLVQAEAFKRATGDNTVKALQEWFGTFPKPQEIQSDNGSHFTAKIVQDWAKDEGVKWVFHTPYYPQANGIVEMTNGLLKRLLKPQETGWDLRLWKAVKERTPRDMKTRQTMITLLILLCILPQLLGQFSTEWPWSEATIRYTSGLGSYPRDRRPNLATVVLHDSEVYRASDWVWDRNDWARALTGMIGEEIKHKVGNYTLDPSTNNIEITKLCRDEPTDCCRTNHHDPCSGCADRDKEIREMGQMQKEYLSPAGAKSSLCLKEGESDEAAVDPIDIRCVQVPAKQQRQSQPAAVTPVETRKSKMKTRHLDNENQKGGPSQPARESEVEIITEPLSYESLCKLPKDIV